MRLAHILLASTSLFVAPVISDDNFAGLAGWGVWDEAEKNPVNLYVTGGCLSFNGRAFNYLYVFNGYRCRAYR
jgi:hypothetical protein